MSNNWAIKSSENTPGVHQNWASLESNQFKARKKERTLGRMEHSQLLPLQHAMGQAHPSFYFYLSWWGPEEVIMMLIPSHLASKYQLWSKCSPEESQDWVPFYFFSFPNHRADDKPQSPEIWLSPSCLFLYSDFHFSWLAEFPVLRVVAQWGKVPWTAWCYKCPFLLSTNIYYVLLKHSHDLNTV